MAPPPGVQSCLSMTRPSAAGAGADAGEPRATLVTQSWLAPLLVKVGAAAGLRFVELPRAALGDGGGGALNADIHGRLAARERVGGEEKEGFLLRRQAVRFGQVLSDAAGEALDAVLRLRFRGQGEDAGDIAAWRLVIVAGVLVAERAFSARSKADFERALSPIM